jgi:hypothetical protein
VIDLWLEFALTKSHYVGIHMVSGVFVKLQKATISFIKLFSLSVCLSVCKEQLGSHWMDFYEISNPELLLKSVEKIQVWLKSDNNIRHFT